MVGANLFNLFFMSVLNFIHPNMQFYILHLLWNWKDDKASCFLCTISCYYGWKFNTTDPVSLIHAYLEGKGGHTAPHHNGPTLKRTHSQTALFLNQNDPNYTYDLFGYNNSIFCKFISIFLIWQAIKTRLILILKRIICDIFSRIYTDIRLYIYILIMLIYQYRTIRPFTDIGKSNFR